MKFAASKKQGGLYCPKPTTIVKLFSFLLLMLCFVGNGLGQTNPTAFDLSTGSFVFATQPATNTTYPTNMQGWTTGTNNIVTPSTAASGADQPLLASGSAGTSGLSNLGVNGFNFLSLGSGVVNQQVGAICVALNSRGRSNILVSWTAADQTSSNGTREMNITLQYRIGISGVFTTVGSSTYTTSNAALAAATNFFNIALPATCENQSVVQIRWITYESASQTGSRDAIRLDDITVSSSSTTTPSLAITGNTTHGSICPNVAATPVQYTITNTGTVASNVVVTSSDAQFVVSGLSANTIAASGGTATYNITFTPTSSGAKTATANTYYNASTLATTSSLSGTGTTGAAQAVTCSAATTLSSTTATLNGNVTMLGICPATTEKGFVYAVSSTNSNPTNGGTGTTKIQVATLATGTYTLVVNGLNSGMNYSFNSYVFDGTNYTYGTTRTFITTSTPVNDLCGNATTITQDGATNAGTMVGATLTAFPSDNGFTADVWYKFIATCTGNMTVATVNNSQDLDLRAYATSCPSDAAAFIGSGLSGSTSSESMTFSVTGGSIYYIRVALFSGTANTFTITAAMPVQAVSTIAASAINSNTATLNGNVAILGACPSTTEKGFVYAVTAVNSSPLVGGSSVIKTTVSGLVTGAYTLAITGLTINTGYSFRAYVYDGATYTYGAITTFTAVTAVGSSAIATWDFTIASASSIPSNLTVSDISQGNNNGTTTLLSPTSPSDYTTASGNNNAAASARSGALNISTSAYFAFTLSPAAGYKSLLASILFGSRSTGTGPLKYTLRSSVDGFATDIANGNLSNNSTWVLYSSTNLNSISSDGTAITYRLYGHDGTGNASSSIANWRVDDLNLTGSITCTTPAVPTVANLTTTYDGTAKNVTATVGANATVDWYSAAIGGTLLSSGSLTSVTNTAAGTYTYYAEARNSICGAVSTARTTVIVTINQQALIITANNIAKTYGIILVDVSGSTAFTTSGLQNSETIGSIVVAYGTGSAAATTVGTYIGSVTPSVATGGTFSALNYNINYAVGDIIVAYGSTAGIWVGVISTNFNTVGNWQNNALPTVSDNITVAADAVYYPLLSSNTTVGNLSLANGTSLDIGNATLTINGMVSGTGVLKGSPSSNLNIGGTGAFGVLYFDQTIPSVTNLLNNFTINRSGSGTLNLGNALNVISVLTPTSGNLTTAGNLTLISTDITGGGSVAAGSGIVSGNVTVQRYTQAQRGYRTLSHSFTTAQPFSQLTNIIRVTGLAANNGLYGVATGNPSAFWYDATKPVGTASVLQSITDATSATNWGVGKALYVFVRGNGNEGSGGAGSSNYSGGTISPVTLSATGAINQGDVPVNLIYGDILTDNYNLIGNPYPSPINLKNVIGMGSFGTVYVYNPVKNIGMADAYTIRGGFDTYTNDGINNIIVPTMGGFYVKATGSGQSFVFKETDKTTLLTPSYNVFGTSKNPLVRLVIGTAQGNLDEVKIGFNSSSVALATDKYDAPKLGNSLFDFYTLSAEKKALAIDYRSDNMVDSTIPLGIKTNLANRFTISLAGLSDMSTTQLVLRDKLLQKETSLLNEGDSYSFDITSDTLTKGNNRFELVLFSNKVLPITFTSFTAQKHTSSVLVKWSSVNEVNTSHFNVQRSMDATSFTTIGKLNAKGGSDYGYIDHLPTIGNQAPTIYYRLQSVDKDATTAFSKTVAVTFAAQNQLLIIFPNPVKAILFAQVTVSKAGSVDVWVTNMQGKILLKQTEQLSAGTTAVPVNTASLANGSYVLVINDNNGQQKQQFVKH